MLFPTLLFLAAAPSLPADAAVFAAGQDAAANGIAGRVEVELMKALKKKGVALADLAALFPAPAAPSSDEGDKLFTEGREAYDNLDFDAANQALTQAAVFFIKRPASAKAEQLAEIFLFLGASELQNGAKAAALKEFARALQMNPSLAPDPKYFGTDVQTAFANAQKEMSKRPKGILTVVTEPAGADVEAFGLAYGMAPLTDIELPAGRYMVRVTRPGFAAAAAFPEVVGAQTADVKIPLEGAPDYLAARAKAGMLIDRRVFAADALPPAAIEVARTMRSRFLVMVSVSTGSLAKPSMELQVWNTHTSDRLEGIKFDAEGFETAAEAVHVFVSRPEAAIAGGGKAMQPSDDAPVFKKWWFWTAVGVVAAGGVTAGVVAAQPRDSGGFNPALGQP